MYFGYYRKKYKPKRNDLSQHLKKAPTKRQKAIINIRNCQPIHRSHFHIRNSSEMAFVHMRGTSESIQ